MVNRAGPAARVRVPLNLVGIGGDAGFRLAPGIFS
jgi:hypothetical protein